jgi:hypothetical protein
MLKIVIAQTTAKKERPAKHKTCSRQEIAVAACQVMKVWRQSDFIKGRLQRLTAATKNKRPGLSTGPYALFVAWQFPTLAWGDPTLPSALRRFTSEFGMGSGGTTALSPPGKSCMLCPVSFTPLLRWPHSFVTVTYLCMLLLRPRLPPCFSAKSFGLYLREQS